MASTKKKVPKSAPKKTTKRTAKKTAAKRVEHRPRVRIHGTTMVLGDASPLKGKVRLVNPKRGPVAVTRPIRVELSRAESAILDAAGGKPSASMVRDAIAAARAHGGGWDHVEVYHPGGRRMAFDAIP